MWSRRPSAPLLVLAVAACTSAGPAAGTIPSIEEARAHLAEIVRLARADDFDGMCALGDLNCDNSLEIAGRDAVPPDPPTIVATRTVPTTSSKGQQSLGGVVFVLCGTDGRGEHYDSEMLVFHDGNGLRAINPVYWGRTRIASSPQTQGKFEPVSCWDDRSEIVPQAHPAAAARVPSMGSGRSLPAPSAERLATAMPHRGRHARASLGRSQLTGYGPRTVGASARSRAVVSLTAVD